MRKLLIVSIAMTIAGLGLAAVATAGDLAVGYQLAGILLAWAGVVKVGVVLLWTHVARLGTDRHRPIPPL